MMLVDCDLFFFTHKIAQLISILLCYIIINITLGLACLLLLCWIDVYAFFLLPLQLMSLGAVALAVC